MTELKQEMKSPDSYASKIGWKETTYPLPNRNFVYIEPVSADCSVHWEVNEGGIITVIRPKEMVVSKGEVLIVSPIFKSARNSKIDVHVKEKKVLRSQEVQL